MSISALKVTAPSVPGQNVTFAHSTKSTKHSAELPTTRFQPSTHNSNPVPDLMPDELYQLLRVNDLLNEKGVRDYIIRRAFRQLREQKELKANEAVGKIQQYYPYLQLDTIRKIIYRVGPGNRKVMI